MAELDAEPGPVVANPPTAFGLVRPNTGNITNCPDVLKSLFLQNRITRIASS
jgi:hypothetical protein